MKNLFAATYAPMTQEGDLNLNILGDYGKFLKRNGIHGAFINGSTGDFASLSTEERDSILEEWAKEKPSDLYLINHVGHINLREAKYLAERSVGKADAISAIGPFYFLPGNVEKLVEYCAEIAGSAPNTPFYYYHLPVLTGVNFPMNDFSRLAKERIENFAGIKFTENNSVEFQKVNSAQKELDIFFGVDEAFLGSLSLNAKGWVGSTYNQLSPLYHAIKTAFEDGNLEEANRLQSLGIHFVERLAALGGFNGAGKSFMQVLGIDCGASRYPHTSLGMKELEPVLREFTELGLDSYFSKG